MLSKALLLFAGVALLSLWLATLQGGERRGSPRLLVAAAASLSHLAPQLSEAFRETHRIEIRFNFAGSNTLSRQIVEGARVDVFMSADAAQMDNVEHAGRLITGTRFDGIGNQLMIVLSPSTPGSSVIRGAPHLAGPAVRRLAMGDPAAVPVGVYARRWLEGAGVWDVVEPKVVPLPSSPAVLAAVNAGRADAGIVYATDAAHGAYVVPAAEAPRIAYPAAAVAGGRIAEARTFLEFLRGPAAGRIFQAARFIHLP